MKKQKLGKWFYKLPKIYQETILSDMDNIITSELDLNNDDLVFAFYWRSGFDSSFYACLDECLNPNLLK